MADLDGECVPFFFVEVYDQTVAVRETCSRNLLCFVCIRNARFFAK